MINPADYWVNNPLITPVNKALLYDNAINNAKADEQERIIKLLWGYIPDPHRADETCEDCEQIRDLIALIEEEN